MKTTWLIVLLAAPLAACTAGEAASGDDAPGDDTGTFTGTITTDRTLTGAVSMTGDATIETGVTVTVSAGTMFEAATGKTLRVKGTLNVMGAAGSEVLMIASAGTWSGIVAETGGTVNIQYVEGGDVANFVYSKMGSTTVIDHVTLTGIGRASQIEGMVTITSSSFEGSAGVNIQTTGNLSATDTHFIGTAGDTVVQTGGVLVLDHVNVGNTSTSNDHCAMHLNAGSDVTVTASNISDTTVGLMIGGTDGAQFTGNNFENLTNLDDISVDVLNTNGVFDGNYITGTPTPIPGITITNPAPAKILTAGPRL
jgi:hypothetical protein